MAKEVPIVEGQVLTLLLFSEPMRVETVHASRPHAQDVDPVGTQCERYCFGNGKRGETGGEPPVGKAHEEAI